MNHCRSRSFSHGYLSILAPCIPLCIAILAFYTSVSNSALAASPSSAPATRQAPVLVMKFYDLAGISKRGSRTVFAMLPDGNAARSTSHDQTLYYTGTVNEKYRAAIDRSVDELFRSDDPVVGLVPGEPYFSILVRNHEGKTREFRWSPQLEGSKEFLSCHVARSWTGLLLLVQLASEDVSISAFPEDVFAGPLGRAFPGIDK